MIINALNIRPGGGLSVLIALASSLSRKCRYTVICNDSQSYGILLDELSGSAGVSVVFIRALSNKYVAAAILMSRSLHRLIPAGDVSISLNHYYDLGSRASIVFHVNVLRFQRAKRPLFSIAEMSDRSRDRLARKAVCCASANVFESKFLMKLARDAVGSNCGDEFKGRVVYIGVKPVSEYVDQAARPHSSRLVCVTSPQPHKDNDTVVRTLATLVQTHPDIPWSLTIAGGRTSSAFDPLKRLAIELGVADRIQWVGFLARNDLAALQARCLCLISASLVESFCMVALEAMAAGCPAVVSDCSSMPESVGNAALLAAPGDPTSFAECVLRLHNSPDLRASLVVSGLDRVSKFSWRSSAAAFDTCVEEVVRCSS